MKCRTRNKGADLCDQNENKEAHRANRKWKPRLTKGSKVAGCDANQNRKEGWAYGSCDIPKGEKLVKGGGDRSDKSKMEGMAHAQNGKRGENSQMDLGRAQGASKEG